MKFSVIFKDLRKSENLNQEEIAKKFNLTRSTISDWENERSEPNIYQLTELAKHFSCSVDYLLGLEDDFAVKTSGQSTDLSRDEQRLLRAFNVLDNITREKLIDDAEFYAKQQSPAVKRQTIKK